MVRSVLVVVLAVDAEHVLDMPSAEDHDSVEAVRANRANPALGVGIRVQRTGQAGVRITLMPSVRKTSSKAWLNFESRSWTRNRNGCCSPKRTRQRGSRQKVEAEASALQRRAAPPTRRDRRARCQVTTFLPPESTRITCSRLRDADHRRFGVRLSVWAARQRRSPV
jgi:hypothetical protein